MFIRFSFLSFLLLSIQLKAQQNIALVDSIAGELVNRLHQIQAESFLITTNKSFYHAGDTLWLNIMVTDSLNNKFTRQSKNLFADLVDNNDSVITRLLLRGDQLYAEGSIQLKVGLPTGLYWLRAYTRKTIDENSNLAIHPLYIVNSKDADEELEKVRMKIKKASPAIGKPIVEVYPEGDNLMSGANSVIALKAHDANGTPLIVSGEVRDNIGDSITGFTTNSMGLASVTISPIWYRHYAIYLKHLSNFDSVAAIPKVNMRGAQLAVTNQTDDSLQIRILLEDSLYSPGYTTYLLCMHADSVCFASVGHGLYMVNIPIRNFPAGETSLLLYNSKRQMISERNVYKSGNPTVNISSDKENYAAKDNIKLNLTVTDSSGKPQVSALTIAVADKKIADTANNFFDDTMDRLSNKDRDLVMLTSPNSFYVDINKFNMMHSESKTNYLSDTLIASGHVYDGKHRPVQQMQVTLVSKKISSLLLLDTTGIGGSFSFELPDFSDGTQFYLQVTNMAGTKQDDLNVEMDATRFQVIKTPEYLKKRYYSKLIDEIKPLKEYENSQSTSSDKNVLAGVTVTKTDPNRNKIASGYIITKEKLNTSYSSIMAAILGSGKFHLLNGFLVSGGPSNTVLSATDEPVIISDGTQMVLSQGAIGETSPVISYLQSLQVEGIDYIKLMDETESGIYGIRGARGVIEIHSATSLPSNGMLKKGLGSIQPQGYHIPLVFEKPDYSNKKSKNDKNPDDRSVLFWKANMITDKEGKASVDFFAGDAIATYVVTVTGITNSGNKFFKTYTITRK